jgi:ataxia telangiectasia mutated family protein
MEDGDGFGPIRTANVQGSTTGTLKTEDDRPTRQIIEICVGVLACGPFLQSPSFKPTRDKELAQLISSSAESHPDKFCLVSPVYFRRVRQGTLSLPIKYFDTFFDKFAPLLRQYSYSRSEPFQCILLELLSSCLGILNSDDSIARDVHQKFSELCVWMSQAFNAKKIRSWILRDAFIRFMDKYLAQDPLQKSWASQDDFQDEEQYEASLPTSLLPTMNDDPDIRVRFRAALVNAQLYSLSEQLGLKPIDMYERMKKFYTNNVDE